MTTFVTIIFVIVSLVMILAILLQSGKGGGLGSALGGGASQGVFGGGGGADFMSKLTQGFAATFMITAMYLAYASAHAGSDFLEESDQGQEQFASDEETDYERIGPAPQPLPTAEEAKQLQAQAAALVPAQSTSDELPPEGAKDPSESPEDSEKGATLDGSSADPVPQGSEDAAPSLMETPPAEPSEDGQNTIDADSPEAPADEP